ncbi:MAG: outer membrane beta-barrel protein, partial [Asticcacaulis sp.]
MAPHAVRGVLLANFNESHGAYSTDLSADVFNFFDNGANNAHRITRTPNQPDQPLFIAQHAGGEGMESSGQHSMPLLGGKLSVNGTYNPSVYRSDASYIGDTTAHESFTDKDTPSELGGQFERKFKNGIGADFNVLDRYEREHQIDVYTDPSGVSDYRALIMSRERIASGRLSWEKSKGLTFTLGSESAFNSRDEVSSFTQNAVPVGLPVSSVRVQEDRNESFASVNWQALPKLSLEGELKVENSTISVPQDNRADSFTYYKPRFQAVYSLTDKTKLSWKSVRQVDQLSFGQFASSIQLQTNQVTLGNTALVPQKKWMNSLILDHTFWDKGALSLAYEHYDIQDTSDYIAVIDGGNIYNAAGNAGDAKGDILHLKLDMPLDRLKVKNGLLNVDWTYRQTRVKDPITGLDRYISGQRPHNYSVSFSQDFPAHSMKWGIDVQSVNDYRNYLANELSWSRWAPWFQTWVEYKTPSKLTFRLTLRNPESLQFTNDRVVYEGLREKSPVAYTQHTTSHIPPIIEIKVKKDL